MCSACYYEEMFITCFRTKQGKVIYARDYGHKAFRIKVKRHVA